MSLTHAIPLLFCFMRIDLSSERMKNMRKYLRKTGIAAVIMIAVTAIAFLPKQTAQWAVLIAVLACCLWNGVRFGLEHKGFLKRKRFAAKTKAAAKSDADETQNYLTVATRQLAHRITDKLHSAYPDSSWQWVEKPGMQLFEEGGHIRIATVQTEEFQEADVRLDAIGRIGIQMLKANPIEEIIASQSEYANADFSIDPEVWYEQRGRKLLFDIITDLNAQGTKSIRIDEKGNVMLADSREVAKLEAFPTKNLWAKLKELLEGDQLKTVEAEDSIELSW